ncbi:MAG: GNAT family N-acetyltransferase [Cellvibrio sp.]
MREKDNLHLSAVAAGGYSILTSISVETISFRPITESDLQTIHEWVQRPHVSEWWSEPNSLEDIREEYLPCINGVSTTSAYIVCIDEKPIGFIQVYVVKDSGGGWWENEDDPGARGIDQFIADAQNLNRGVGTLMIKTFISQLLKEPNVSKIQTDPSPDNKRAINCYRKVGFHEIGEVITPDGPAMLMLYKP